MVEKSCVHPFIEQAQKAFAEGQSLGEVIKSIKPYQQRVEKLVKNVSREAKIPHAVGMSVIGLGAIAIYEYARAHGAHWPDSGQVISGLLPVASFTRNKDEEIEDLPKVKWTAEEIMGVEGKKKFDEKMESVPFSERGKIIDENNRELMSDPVSRQKLEENFQVFLEWFRKED